MRFHLEGLTKKEENVKLTCKTWKMNENCSLIFFVIFLMLAQVEY